MNTHPPSPRSESALFGEGRNGFSIGRLRHAYAEGHLTVTAMAQRLLARLMSRGEDPVWISRQSEVALLARAAALDALARSNPEIAGRMPLFGVPFAIKDNIDLAGLPTTAACPDFAYLPDSDAVAVARLIAAGAVPVGKTNLDQFAAGLVGVRSPYGVPVNAIDARFVPGGSSSGSAVAVAAGLSSFSLGTDTAGSGRVPASFNGIVGLKPTRGLVSTRGVVPACRSLDCVSVFALDVADALAVFSAMAEPDPADPFGRRDRDQLPELGPHFRFGVLSAKDLVTCGDPYTAALLDQAAARLRAMGGEPVEVPFAPFRETSALLYEGPWLAERMAGIGAFYQSHADSIHPVTRAVIEGAGRYSATDAFRGRYRLAELSVEVAALWRDIDLLLVPSAPTIYTVEQVLADPIRLNSNLGTYTNFVNLLDLSALALPAGTRPDGMPFGITLIGPALADRRLAALGMRFENQGLGSAEPPAPGKAHPHGTEAVKDGRVTFAVLGAHLSGMALNPELRDLGGRLVGPARTAPHYRLFLLDGAPSRPGLLKVAGAGGGSIEAELWSLAEAEFGRFVAGIAAPLGIGTLELDDGRQVKGFLCEAVATRGARDITEHGGWRGFVAAKAQAF